MQSGVMKPGLFAAIGLAVSATAAAAPGDHIRLGDAVLTPSVMTGIEAHSNLYLADGGPQTPEVTAMAWVLRPRLGLELDGRQVKFELGAGYGLKKFVDWLDSIVLILIYSGDLFILTHL